IEGQAERSPDNRARPERRALSSAVLRDISARAPAVLGCHTKSIRRDRAKTARARRETRKRGGGPPGSDIPHRAACSPIRRTSWIVRSPGVFSPQNDPRPAPHPRRDRIVAGRAPCAAGEPHRDDHVKMRSMPRSNTESEATLLVVEDDENICELLATSLRYAGFAVHAVGSGDEALRAVARHRPDLVVLDVNLPDFDGFEVVRRLRSGSDHTPVLFLTARDDTADTVTGLSAGGDDYITKPFALE